MKNKIKTMWIVEIGAKTITAVDDSGKNYKRVYDVQDGWIGDVEKSDDAYIIGVKRPSQNEGEAGLRINFMSLPVCATSIFWKDIERVYKVFSK